MKKLIRRIIDSYKHSKMKTQMGILYLGSVFLPILILGMVLIFGNVNRLSAYHNDLLKSNNDRVRSVLYEITSQLYNISEEVVFDEDLVEILSASYPAEQAFKDAADEYTGLDYYLKNYMGISAIKIFTNQEGVTDYGNFCRITEEMEAEPWFKAANNQYSAYWDVLKSTDSYGNTYWNLALIRKITLYNSESDALLVILLDDNYLNTRIETDNYSILLAMDDKEIFYSSNRADYGRKDLLDVIDNNESYYTYQGDMSYYDSVCLTCITTLNMTQSDSLIYVTTLNATAYTSIQQIIIITVFIIILALVLPAVMIRFFVGSFDRQLMELRDEMYKVSTKNYNLIPEFDACRELQAAYGDLKVMVENIKDKDARMYAGKIAEQKLLNEQQKMEFQMLASQINPHFLYNTLEMIRMKAITAGDRETAKAIKLLGKSMRYVLSNTGTEYTTLAKELEHIETYLQIQKLRFGDRVNYTFLIEDGLEPEKISILPLLLQPIVENSILHGLEEVETGGKIDVKVFKTGEYTLAIEISDNGCGMDRRTLIKMRENLGKGGIEDRSSIGLYNINQRIKICYGASYGLSMESEKGKGTTVTAKIRLLPYI